MYTHVRDNSHWRSLSLSLFEPACLLCISYPSSPAACTRISIASYQYYSPLSLTHSCACVCIYIIYTYVLSLSFASVSPRVATVPKSISPSRRVRAPYICVCGWVSSYPFLEHAQLAGTNLGRVRAADRIVLFIFFFLIYFTRFITMNLLFVLFLFLLL